MTARATYAAPSPANADTHTTISLPIEMKTSKQQQHFMNNHAGKGETKNADSTHINLL